MNEFNQCQTQLSALHNMLKSRNRLEFISYRLLYNIALNNAAGTLEIVSELHATEEQRAEAETDECVKFALAIRDAWSTNNYR